MPMHDLDCNHPKPHFTRMHYQLIADQLRYDGIVSNAYSNPMVISLANLFANDNHLFDRYRWYDAINGNTKGYR